MKREPYEEIIDTRKEQAIEKQENVNKNKKEKRREELRNNHRNHKKRRNLKRQNSKYKRKAKRRSRLLIIAIAIIALMLLIDGKGFGFGNGLGLGLGKGNGNGSNTEKTNKEQFSDASANKIDEKDYGENTLVITVKDYNIYYNGNKVSSAKELEEKILSVDDYEKKEVILKDNQARMTAYDEVKGTLEKLNLKYNEQN